MVHPLEILCKTVASFLIFQNGIFRVYACDEMVILELQVESLSYLYANKAKGIDIAGCIGLINFLFQQFWRCPSCICMLGG
jgi:hypothetical protein